MFTVTVFEILLFDCRSVLRPAQRVQGSEKIKFSVKNQKKCSAFVGIFFFSIWVFYHDHSRITGLQGKGEGISLTPHYHFHPLHRHLDISRTITAESSPLYIATEVLLELLKKCLFYKLRRFRMAF